MSGKAIIDAFFDGFGPTGLFVPMEQPGAPTEVFESEFAELERALHEAARDPEMWSSRKAILAAIFQETTPPAHPVHK